MSTTEVATNPAHKPQCLDCEYPLIALTSNRCPECGREFDLSRRETFGPRNENARALKRAITGGVFTQVIILLVFSSIMAEGVVATGLLTVLGHVIAMAIIRLRRAETPTKCDLQIALAGSLLLLMPTLVMVFVCPGAGWLRELLSAIARHF